jgi:hypothetical protein
VSGTVPEYLLVHQITVEPYQGDGAYGPQYGGPVTVRCFLDQQTRMVRSKTGTEITSTGTAYCHLAAVAPPDSRVTLPDGRQATVIAALRRDGAGLPLPSHLEVQLT